jgi:beta-1,4-mannosyl-glycoprotein beta-1,4-N-acetylglucosaminyltransferase
MVIDSFIFNDELDLLELRLGQLDPVVDYFVFVETKRTFSGMVKPLYYQDNKHLFERWNHKIIHAAPELPNVGSWEYEALPREALVKLVRDLNPAPSTTLTFSDLDEIPNPEVIRSYTPDLGLRNLRQFTFYYNFNHLFDYGNRAWSRARIGVVQDMFEHGAVGFRGGWPVGRDMDASFPAIENGGWHGSYFGYDLERMRRKVLSISHDDLWPFINGRTNQQLADDVLHGRDLYHRAGIGDAQWVNTDDPRLPSYFRENKERFKMFTNAHFAEMNKALL